MQEVLGFSRQPDSIAAHVSALAQLTPKEPARKKAGQKILAACQEVLEGHVKRPNAEHQRLTAALYTVSKVKSLYSLLPVPASEGQ